MVNPYLFKADLLIKNCTIISLCDKKPVENGVIAIKGDLIAFAGKRRRELEKHAERVIDADGKVAIPGLINCHTHAPMTLFRGVAEDKSLDEWLRQVIWPLEAKLRAEDVYYGAMLGCLEMIKAGTTCFVDMYFYEDMVAKAAQKVGIRAFLAPGIIEAGNPKLGEKMLKEAIEVIKQFNGIANGRIRFLLGPHAVYTCSPKLLMKIRDFSAKLKVGLHIHLAESKELAEEVMSKYGVSETELLEKIGFLGPDVLAAHCIHLTDRDIKLLAKNEVSVVHNPVANMKLGQGAARIKKFIDAGINVCLGTDGPASNNSLDMFESMKIACLLQKLVYEDPSVLSAWQVLRMATLNAAKALGAEKELGTIETGKKADIVLVNFENPNLIPVHDYYANLVYSAKGRDVDTVIIDGKVVMENRKMKTVDEKEVIKKAAETAYDIIKR